MALSPPYIVRVERKPERSFGQTMNDIRFWLDHHTAESISFKPVANVRNGVGFEIAFNSQDQAFLLKREFA